MYRINKNQMSFNQITLIGRVGQDPKFFNTKSGSRLATLSIATTDVRRNIATQELIKETQWHKIVILNSKIIPIVEKMVNKGSQIFICGKLQYQKYLDQVKNETKTSTEITIKESGHHLIVLDDRQRGRNNDNDLTSQDFNSADAAGQAANYNAAGQISSYNKSNIDDEFTLETTRSNNNKKHINNMDDEFILDEEISDEDEDKNF